MEEIKHYRACVAVMVIRPSSVCSPDGCKKLFEVLLVHKPRKRDDWQLPQGGKEKGETLEQTAERELKEETNLEVKILGKSEHIYKYDYPASYRRARPDHLKGQRLQFVFATPIPGSKVKVDDDEIDAHSWVLPENIGQYIEREVYMEVINKLLAEVQSLVESI